MLYQRVQEAVARVRNATGIAPRIAIILGSGLGDLASEIQDGVTIPYEEIPHFARSTVVGHAGQLLLGHLEGSAVVVMQGRFHLYEGYTPQTATFPVRVMRELGAETLLISNAAGGVNLSYRPGDFMVIKDHLNFPGLAGANPLIGPNESAFGERFPAMGRAYEPELRQLAKRVAGQKGGMRVHEGVYAMVSGPSYETGAEIRFLRTIGADAVGMSTAPEVVVARHMGMRVLGISLITNPATGGDEAEVINHAEVLAEAEGARTRFADLVRGIIKELVE